MCIESKQSQQHQGQKQQQQQLQQQHRQHHHKQLQKRLQRFFYHHKQATENLRPEFINCLLVFVLMLAKTIQSILGNISALDVNNFLTVIF